MDQSQINIEFLCKSHIDRPITYIHVANESNLPSRLLCALCFKELKPNIDECEELGQFLKEPLILLKLRQTQNEQSEQLLNYFEHYKFNIDQLIDQFSNSLLKVVNQMKDHLKESIDKYNEQQCIAQEKKQKFNETIGLQELIQSAQNSTKDSYQAFEESVTKFINSFQNQKLDKDLIASIKDNDIFNPFIDIDMENIEKKLHEQVIIFRKKIIEFNYVKSFTDLLDIKFQQVLVSKINQSQPKKQFKLIFKGTKEGMNYNHFWEKCTNQHPTLLIAKSKFNQVFGYYTPCKLFPNGKYQVDDTLTSFIFQATKQEIYPIKKDKKHLAVFCDKSNTGQTIRIGGGHDLCISQNFQQGSSVLGHSYSIDDYKIENVSSHLFGGVLPKIQEVEVYIIV